MHRPNLQSVALAFSEIIATAVLQCGCEPKSWGREAVGLGYGTVRKSVGEFL